MFFYSLLLDSLRTVYSLLPDSLQTVVRWIGALLGFGLCIGALAIVYSIFQSFLEADSILELFRGHASLLLVIALSLFWMGFKLIIRLQHHIKQRAHEEAEAHPEPWTAREEWTTKELTQTNRVRSSRVFAAVIVLLVSVVGGISMTMFFPALGAFPILGLIGGLLSGLFLARQEWTPYKRSKRFGISKATLETMPARLGQRIRAQVQAGIDRSEFPVHGAQVQLSCYRRTARYKRRRKSRKLKERLHLLWRGEKQMQAIKFDSSGAHIPVSFEVPGNMPRSTAIKRSKAYLARTGASDIVWEITVRAEVPGLNYKARFEVPVYEPEEASSEDYIPDASPQSDKQPESEEQPEQVLWDLDTDQEVLQVGQDDEVSSNDPYADHTVELSLTGPISKYLSLEQVGSQGLRIHQNPNRTIGLSVLMAVVGLGIIGAIPYILLAVDLSQLNMVDFALIFGLGPLFCWIAWTSWPKQKTITVADGEVEVKVKRRRIGGKSERFSVMEVEDIDVRIAGTQSNLSKYPKSDYQVVILKRDDAKGAGSLKSGITDVLEWVLGRKSTDTMKGSTQNYAVRLNNLKNKQEADWLAQQLRDAVQAEQRYA